MILQCTNCAGSVSAEETDIKKGYVVCGYCQCGLRISHSEVKNYEEAFNNLQPPEGILVDRSKGYLKLQIPMLGGPNGSTLRTVTLKDGIIKRHREFLVRTTFPVKDIKQLYLTVNTIDMQGEDTQSINLYALMHDSQRLVIFWNFLNIESALYIEELFEIEIGILDLPVYGDLFTGMEQTKSSSSSGKLSCFACAAPLTINKDVKLRGFVECEYCQTITLLLTMPEYQEILGKPTDDLLQYRPEATENGLTIFLKNRRKKKLLTVQGQQITYCSELDTRKTQLVTEFGLKKVLVPKKFNLLGVKGFVDRLEQTMAYSENTKIEDVAVDVVDHILKFEVVGMVNGESKTLIKNIDNIAEAVLIISKLKEVVRG